MNNLKGLIFHEMSSKPYLVYLIGILYHQKTLFDFGIYYEDKPTNPSSNYFTQATLKKIDRLSLSTNGI